MITYIYLCTWVSAMNDPKAINDKNGPYDGTVEF